MNVNANIPNYVPKYLEWTPGEPVRNIVGITKEEFLTSQLKLEIGTRLREAIPWGKPSYEGAVNNLKIDIIRQLMSEQEEDSLAMNILQRMLESAQNQQPFTPTVDITGEVIEPPVIDVKG